jgi:hypothetical protein
MKANVVSFDMPTERPAGFWRHSPFEFWAVLIGWNQNIGLRIFTFGKDDWSCGRRHMRQDPNAMAFVLATVFLAVFFSSVAVALNWLG